MTSSRPKRVTPASAWLLDAPKPASKGRNGASKGRNGANARRTVSPASGAHASSAHPEAERWLIEPRAPVRRAEANVRGTKHRNGVGAGNAELAKRIERLESELERRQAEVKERRRELKERDRDLKDHERAIKELERAFKGREAKLLKRVGELESLLDDDKPGTRPASAKRTANGTKRGSGKTASSAGSKRKAKPANSRSR